jgi:hypothetical protein
MSDYSMSAYALANALYEKTNTVGIALHNRPAVIREAWVKTAQRQMASGTVSLDDIAKTGAAH